MPWFVRDLQFAIRKFWHAPGLTLTAIVTLTLGIGANTAIFSLVDGAWLRPLPIRDPAHLVSIQSVKESAAADSERDTGSSFAEFEDLQRSVRAFSAMAATSGRGVVLDQNGNLRLLLARVVSENYFSVMGASAQIGRLPTEQEMREAKTPLVVLGNAAWKDIFGGEPKVIGTDVKVTQGMAHIAAVLPPGFRGMDRMIDPQIYVSRTGWLTWNPRDRQVPRTNRDFDLYARLRPGATLAEAREQLGVAAAQLAAAYPAASTGRGFKANWEAK